MYTCKCNQCNSNVLNVTSVSVSSGSFFFVTNSTETLKNGCRYILKVPCTLMPQTATTTLSQVYAVVNQINIPLQTICGNHVFSDQIRCFNVDNCGNIILRLVYGSTPSHLKIVNQELCCSNAYGTTATTTVSTTSSASLKSKTNTTE